MLKDKLDAVRFFIRASGLSVVIAIAGIIGVTCVFSETANAVMAVGCGLVLAAAVLSWPRWPNAWRSDPPTERQIEYAESLGIDVTPEMTKGGLSDLITAYRQARDQQF